MAPGPFAAACDRVQPIWADMASRGQPLRPWVAEVCGWLLESGDRPRRWGRYPIAVDPPPLPALTV